MNLSSSTLRKTILLILFVSEVALVVSLRINGWTATGLLLEKVGFITALIIPMVMSFLLLYQVRSDFGNFRISVRAMMVLTLVMATAFSLWPLFPPNPGDNYGPKPLVNSASFEIYHLAHQGIPGAVPFKDPIEGLVYVHPAPIISEVEIETVEFSPGSDKHSVPSLLLSLTPTGGARLGTATARAKGKHLAIIVNGEIVSVPRVRSTMGRQICIEVDNPSQVFSELTIPKAVQRQQTMNTSN